MPTWFRTVESAYVAGVLLSVLSLSAWASDPASVRFQNISRAEGLSQSFVYTIVQDQDGFMWFGTQDGLNRYDGFEIKVFNHDPEDPLSISDESIRTMIMDSSGVLWTGTDAGGLSRYDRESETFTNFVHDPADPNSISDNRVRILYEDSEGRLWVGTDGAGLNLFDRNSETFERFPFESSEESSLPDGHVWSVLENSYGEFYVATSGGLSKFDPETRTFQNYRHDPNDPSSLNDNAVRVLYEDKDMNLWVGTEKGGLNRFDYGTETFDHFTHDPGNSRSVSANQINSIRQDNAGVLWIGTVEGLNTLDPGTGVFQRYLNSASDRYSISHNNVTAIYQDNGGVLWIGTYNGVNWWSQHNRAMGHFRNDAGDPSSLSEDTVMSFAENPDGRIWVATFGGGLNLLDRTSNEFERFRHDASDTSSISSDQVMSLAVDHDGALWAGTRSTGLNRYDRVANRFTRFRNDPDDPTSLSADGVTYIFEDSRENLWVATFGGGLNKFDRDTQSFIRYRHDPNDPDSLGNDRVLLLFEDSKGFLWAGTYGGGLNRLDPATGKFKVYRADPQRPDGLSGDEIYTIEEDTWGDFWIGVKGRGLNRWRRADREAGREVFQRLGIRDGLPSTTIYSSAWDQSGYLWLSTGRGLSRLDIGTLEFTNYDTSHGLQDDEFHLSAGLRAADGELFFGGVKGFNAFYPHLLNGHGPPPQVAITRFLNYNDPDSSVGKRLNSGGVSLEHDENLIGFQFAALDFAAPGKNTFRYKLDGIDDDWVEAGTRREVTYTNLPAGDYTFRVVASSNNRIWSEQEATFDISVQPSPWRTWWAFLLYVFAGAALLATIIRTHIRDVQHADKLKHAEELAVIQERLTHAQRMARIGNWEWDLVTNEPWWSEEVFRLFQIDPESKESKYESIMNRIHSDDRPSVTHAIQSAMSGELPFEVEYRIVLPDGTQRVVHGRAETTFDENGEPLRMAGTIHDITERKKADDDFRNRAAFQSLLASLSSELVRAQPRDVGGLLNEGIKAVGDRYDLDMISLWWFAEGVEAWRPLHRWTRVDDGHAKRDLPSDQIPWIAGQLRDGQMVIVDDVDDIPEEASVDLEVFRQRGNQSFVIIPLLIEEILEGACAFVVTREKRSWSQETITELRLFAENWAGAVARTTAMAEIEQLKNKLQQENLYLREEVKLAHGFSDIVGEDPALKRSLEAVEKVAPTDVAALILGETGTGKELIARSIHKLSGRHDKPMVSVNCPSLPSTLIESELFGHEKGAFTGAQSQRRGRFELAKGGTLFLDEIGDLPLDLQAKLLRVLQTGEFERIGGSKTIIADVRLIAATNRDLKQAVDDGEFRADLFYRINSFPINMPPLRERKNDIPLLAEHFVHKHAKRLGKNIDAISAKMIIEFMNYEWPGNVRELESIIERSLISAEDNKVLELPGPLRSITGGQESNANPADDGGVDLQAVERSHIVSVLEQTKWKITGEHGAAAILGMPPSTLRSKMKRLGIVRKDR